MLAHYDELLVQTAVSQGVITDWDVMEKVWHHCFHSQLKVDPQEHAVVMSEWALNPKVIREITTETMFEKFSTPRFFLGDRALFSLVSTGRDSGLVLDLGHDMTSVTPVYGFYVKPHAVRRLELAGKDLNEWMCKLLSQRGHSFKTFAQKEAVRDIKETLCHVAADDQWMESIKAKPDSDLQREYTLPDGQSVTVGLERYQCPEAQFQPSLLGRFQAGVHEATYNTVVKLGTDIRFFMYSNILLSGGTSLIPGFATRLQKEVNELVPPDASVVVHTPPGHEYNGWTGGSVIASLPTFQQLSVSKAEYEEQGVSVIYRKFF